jgi:hypothetical protein
MRYGRTIDIDREREEAELARRAAPTPLDYADLGLNIGGTLLGAYGTYKAGELAEEQHRDAMRAYREERDRENRLDAQAEDQRQLGNMMGFANYARDLEQDVYGTYTPWARRQGL